MNTDYYSGKFFSLKRQWLYSLSVLVSGLLVFACQDTSLPARNVSSGADVEGRGWVRTTPSVDVMGTGRRIALVIGNSAYNAMPEDLQPLVNPIHDAEDIAVALRRLRFDVTLLKDATLEQMDDGIYNLGQGLRNDDIVLLYYSGHGMQVKGENYLLPVDAKFEREDQIERQSIRASDALDKIATAKTKLVFLDACRNNPFASRSKRAGMMRGGLSKMDTPTGTLLVYSTNPDNYADDGVGQRNSPFTHNLLAHIGDSGVDVQLMLRDVRVGVKDATKGKQIPWDASSLEGGPFYLVSAPLSPKDGDPRIAALEAQLAASRHETAVLEQQVTQPSVTRQSTPVVKPVPPVQAVRRSFEPEMVDIPAGSFMMGSPATETGRDSDEGPVHQVTVAAFQLGKYELTRGQFRAFVDASGYKTEAEQGDGCYDWNGSSWENKKEYNWQNLGFSQTDAHPVACISWNDAQAYVKWLSQQTGKRYWLPTEAEWEYAARAGTTTARLWGDDPNSACQYANVADQASKRKFNWYPIHECDDGYVYTAPVGQFKPNAFGLYDMLGNVLEWCQDRYHNDYNGAPTIGSAWESGASPGKVLRGGCSWYFNPTSVRSAYRNSRAPGHRSFNLGVRVASFAFART